MAKMIQMPPLTRALVRQVDRRAIEEYGVCGLVLMENAGRGCVDTLLAVGCTGPVVIVCGRGNNAGDGFVIARHLDLRSVAVQVVLLGAPQQLRGDAAANYTVVARSGIPLHDMASRFEAEALASVLRDAEWIVDALLGTGAEGPPRPPWDEAIRLMNEAPGRRLAVDLPSGLDCDTGQPSPATVRADHTCTFVAPKVGFLRPDAAPYVGQVHVVDIGAPRRLLEEVAELARSQAGGLSGP
jgi:NAD(P)H-hydrate epimerase